METFWTKYKPSEESMKQVLSDQLRKATPNEHSVDEKAKRIAILISEEQAVHWKTCRNWLNGDHLPHMKYLAPLGALIGSEMVFRLIFGGDEH